MKTKTTFSKLIAVAILSLILTTQTRSQVTLYGLTSGGGTHDVGTLFSVNPAGSFTTIANINSTFAAIPAGSPLYASDGNFYASSVDGGYADSCTIFRCSPTGTLKTMINLDSVWGSSDPDGNSLIQALDGNLYGMTTMGGTGFYGVLFELQLSGQYSAVHFFNGTDGASAYGSLIQTSDGTFWGMTSAGGVNRAGNIFSCTPSGTFNSVYSFVAASDGSAPFGDLLLANDGNFYGLTSSGGTFGFGTLFRFNPSGTFTKLVDFNDTNGANPYGSLIQASDGNLYGLTSKGGILERNTDFGTLFECTLSGQLTTLMQFNDSLNGANPDGSLMQASDGNLYGMTSGGGQSKLGTIFQYSLSHVFKKLVDFSGTNGSNPKYGKLIEENSISTGLNKIVSGNNTMIYPNPNNGKFTIQSSVLNGQSSVEIYNEIGEQVETHRIASSQATIDLSNKSNGVYFYRVINENGGVITNGKFVIEK